MFSGGIERDLGMKWVNHSITQIRHKGHQEPRDDLIFYCSASVIHMPQFLSWQDYLIAYDM